jgi:hypothetical protein
MDLSVTTNRAKSFKDIKLPKDATSIADICVRSEKQVLKKSAPNV